MKKKSDYNEESRIVTGISDDIRKSILFDVTKAIRDDANKKITVILSMLMIVIALITYFGYDALSKQLIREMYNKEYNPELIAALDETKAQLNAMIEKGKKIEEMLIKRESSLIEMLNDEELELMNTINMKERELTNLTEMIASFEISNTSIESVINGNHLMQISEYDGFQFIYPLGLSDTTILKTLVTYGDLSLVAIDSSTINRSISIIQEKFKLVPDGKIGPCTSFLLAAVSIRYFPTDTKKELSRSLYRKNYWYLNVLKACYESDKIALKSAFEYDDNPFHYELLEVAELIGSHKSHIFNMLEAKAVDETAYHVLDILKMKEYSRTPGEEIIN